MRRAVWTARRRDVLAGYLFVAPQVLGWALFVLTPAVMVIWYSLHSWNALAGTFQWIGLGNYRQLAHDPVIPSVVVATVSFTVALVVCNLVIALVLAIALNNRFAGRTFFRAVFFSPVVVSLVAWTIVWRFLLQADGGINGLLAEIHVHGPNWLRSSGTAMASAVLVQVVKNVGLNMVLFLAALSGVPKELYEAAQLDGAGRWRLFRRITLPMISPTVLLTGIITTVGALQVFAQIQVLTGGGPGNSTTILVYYLYEQAFQFNHLGYGSALAVVLFAVVLVLTLLQWGLRRRWVFHES